MIDIASRSVLTSDCVYIAYQTAGAGPVDLVRQPDSPGNIDMEWEAPAVRTLLTALAFFGRVILHDYRGIGLSSRNVDVPGRHVQRHAVRGVTIFRIPCSHGVPCLERGRVSRGCHTGRTPRSADARTVRA